MTSRFARLALALSLALAASAFAQTPPATPTPQVPALPPGAGITLKPGQDEIIEQVRLPDADLETILATLEIYTGRIILRPTTLPVTQYNLKISTPMPKSAIIRYLETILAMNGIAVVPLDEKSYKVVALNSARTEAPELITGSPADYPPSGKVATKLFPLDFARVAELQPILTGVLNPLFGGPQQVANANAFLITDSITNLQRVEILLKQLDKPTTGGLKPKFYSLRYAKASDLVGKLRTILAGPLQTQLGSVTTYNADDRTNQIVLVTDPRQYAFFDELIQKLDVKSDPNTRNDVIPLSHAKAVDVVNVLTRIIQGQSQAIRAQGAGSARPGAANQPAAPAPAAPAGVAAAVDSVMGGTSEFSGIMTVVNDDRSNSVVVSGTADDLRLLRELVSKLDIVLAQVRIEVVIAEVTLDDNHQSGITALGLKVDGDKIVGFSATAIGGSAANGTITRPGKSGSFDLATDLSISSTPRKTNSTIMSVPAIVTSHGKPSVVFSGETRPVVSGVISSAMGSSTGGLSQQSSVTQQRIGTRLEVTPYIGVDGSVQLDMKQTVEDVTGEVQIDSNTQYIIGTREMTSYSTAKSGEIIFLGGFQKKINSKSSSRLGPIPIIGDLFGSRRSDNYRQELIFFLRPMVLTNTPTVDNAEALQRLEKLPSKDDIKEQLDPKYERPKPTLIEKILPR
jgi:general secretion pathway protein D